MKNNLIMIAFFVSVVWPVLPVDSILICTMFLCMCFMLVVTGRCQYREQQEIERVGKGHTAQNVIGACGYHIGNAAFFLSGRFSF